MRRQGLEPLGRSEAVHDSHGGEIEEGGGDSRFLSSDDHARGEMTLLADDAEQGLSEDVAGVRACHELMRFVERYYASCVCALVEEESEADVEHGAGGTLINEGAGEVDDGEGAGRERPGRGFAELGSSLLVLLIFPFALA